MIPSFERDYLQANINQVITFLHPANGDISNGFNVKKAVCPWYLQWCPTKGIKALVKVDIQYPSAGLSFEAYAESW